MYCDDFTMKISNLSFDYVVANSVNELMESKGGKKKSSSSSSKSSLFYEAPLGYSIEDIRPNGGIKKFRSAAYSNVNVLSFE
jgi:S-adenosylmethionine decarboxylase